jgi:hypothetical protein
MRISMSGRTHYLAAMFHDMRKTNERAELLCEPWSQLPVLQLQVDNKVSHSRTTLWYTCDVSRRVFFLY